MTTIFMEFFDPLFDDRYPQLHNEENQKRLDFYLDYIKLAHTMIGYDLIDQLETTAQSMGIPRRRPLDVSFPGAVILMHQWRKEIIDDITLIHDKSSRMKEVIPIWDTFFHPHPPPNLSQHSSGGTKSVFGIAETYTQEDSKNWRGLQLADILTGATKSWLNGHLMEKIQTISTKKVWIS